MRSIAKDLGTKADKEVNELLMRLVDETIYAARNYGKMEDEGYGLAEYRIQINKVCANQIYGKILKYRKAKRERSSHQNPIG